MVRVGVVFAILLLPALALAQTTARPAPKAAAAPAPAASGTKAKPVAVTKGRAKVKTVVAGKADASSPALAASQSSAAAPALSRQQLTIAKQVETGRIQCGSGLTIDVRSIAAAPGYFDVGGKKFSFRMAPVFTSTGAIRLEDPATGAVWLQLPAKSMLMNAKLGIRLADECMTPAQKANAVALAKNPLPGLLASKPKPKAAP